MNRVRGWIKENQDPQTGRVFGLMVGGTTAEKDHENTVNFRLDTDEHFVMVIIWERGLLNLEKADLTRGPNASDDEIYYGRDYAFEEIEPLIAAMENFIKESLPK